MEKDMILTFTILIITTALFIHGKVRSDIIAVGSLLSLALLNIITPSEALAGFSNSVVIMIAGLFIVGAGIFNTGLAERIGNQLIKFGGDNEIRLLIIILLTVAIFSAFMSNTGTVAILLPVVVSMALHLRQSPSQFLMPLAFASSLGGMLTLIGTPPNLVVSNILKENAYESLHFFQLTPIGLVALICGILFLATIGRKLLPKREVKEGVEAGDFSVEKLAGMYKIYDALYLMKVPQDSTMIGKTLVDLDLTTSLGITVVSIHRQNNSRIQLINQQKPIVPKAKTKILAGDLLLLFGPEKNIFALQEKYQLEQLESTLKNIENSYFLSRHYGITEILVVPQSGFENKTIRQLHFRKRFGCTVLALYRGGKYIQTDVGKEPLKAGDALLIHGLWPKIELLAKTSRDVVVVGRVSDQATTAYAKGKAPIALMIMLFMLILMTFELIAPVITVLIAAFLMLITGCLRSSDETYRTINWESVILIAAMLPIATALEKTGGVEFLSDTLIHLLGGYGPYAILAGFYGVTMLLSQFISNTATAVIFAPIALTTATSLGVSPYPFVIAVAIAASMAFSTPVASPTNALVMNAGGYRFSDYVKVGVPLQIFLAMVMIFIIPLFYSF